MEFLESYSITHIVGFVGGIASILALFQPRQSWRSRLSHASYVLMIVIISSFLVHYKYDLDERKNAYKEALFILKSPNHTMSAPLFNMSALVFFERHQNLYPDTYQRALDICADNVCWDNESVSNDLNDRSRALRGMLMGVGITEAKKG